MTKDIDIVFSLKNLENYVRKNNYSGFDPYDALNSRMLNSLNIRFLRLISTQIVVYSPINFRKFLKIENEKNPKAIGIFLQAYCRLFQQNLIEKKDFENITKELIEFLMQNRSIGYSGDCWGFNFDWQDLDRYAKKGVPTIVVTSYVANAFLDMYKIMNNKKYLDIARSSCEFILKDLYITKTERGICFSYTPIDKYIVHNANALGSALLARVYAITKENILLEYSKQAFNYLMSYQKNDGSWSYNIDLDSRKEGNQIDFHQGFIIDAICDFIRFNELEGEKYLNDLRKAVSFYEKNQFYKDGYAMWRLPHRYPIDIHHQAQGIITFSKLYSFYKEDKYLEFSKKIAEWTIKNMQDEKGYFYFQKWPFFTNKISYIRWGQAWMMLAFTSLLCQMNKINKNYE
jgi:hypothetical protein